MRGLAADRAKVITACATLARTSWHVDDEEMAEGMRQHCCVARDAVDRMHARIRELEVENARLREATGYGHASLSERSRGDENNTQERLGQRRRQPLTGLPGVQLSRPCCARGMGAEPMTHVLDEAIAALEGDIRDIRKYGPGVCDPNDDSRSDAVSMVRSKAAALRILRAERAESRDDHVYRAVMAERERQQRLRAERDGRREDELRAEGRREERGIVCELLHILRRELMEQGDSYGANKLHDMIAHFEHGDHWRGGEG